METSVNATLEAICSRLESIEETLHLIRQHQLRRDIRLDHFQNKLIALEASLDEKLGLWKESQQIG